MAAGFTVTGLKTGSTSAAKYCLSATAQKDGVRLIAAIMAAPDYKVRFTDARNMLNYGYASCRLYEDREPPVLEPLAVVGGVENQVPLAYEGIFSYLGMKGEALEQVEKQLVLKEVLPAPVEPGQEAGSLVYSLNGAELGRLRILTAGTVRKAGYIDYIKKLWKCWKL